MRSFHASSAGVARMPRKALATDAHAPRIRLEKYTQNLQNVGLPAEIFLRAGKSMDAESLCNLSGKGWQGLYGINHR